MRNRQAYLILAAAAVLLSACVKSEVTSSKVSFAPVASKSTRAIISGATYPQTESFAVSAFHGGSTPYFENLTASYKSALNLWATEEDQYWPLAGSLIFKAYSPAGLTGVTIDETDGITAADYTVSLHYNDSDESKKDFCYATAEVADCANHPESVPLVFSHALSQVVFRVKAASYEEGITFAMTSLALKGINSVGDFADGTWSNQETEVDYPLSSSETALTYTANEPDTIHICSYLFIPQRLGANAALSVGYNVEQTVNNTTFTLQNPPVSVPIGVAGYIRNWDPGKKYIYTISIGLNNLITFTATAVEWNEALNSGVVVE